MNLINNIYRWTVVQSRRALLATCDKKLYQGFTLYAVEDAEKFFDITIKSLDLIQKVDARRYKRVKKYIESIAYVKLGIHAYVIELHSYFNDVMPSSVQLFASGIVHEATHGYLASRGFPYVKAKQAQHERICTKEQFYFIKKATLSSDLSDDKKEERIKYFKDYLEKSLKKEWWDSKIQKEKRVNRFKSFFYKEYIHKEHNATGHLEFECKMVKGKKDGYFKRFYENGNIKETGTYKNGLLHGLYKSFNEDASLKNEKNYENGKVIIEVDKAKEVK